MPLSGSDKSFCGERPIVIGRSPSSTRRGGFPGLVTIKAATVSLL
jgi:hypothetical protein